MSFRHRKNNKGLITVPSWGWGGEAPDKTGAHKSDFTPFTTTRCCLKHRKESIHFNVLPQSIANQFAFKGCNKCLFKIQYECVNLSSIVQTFSPVIYYRSQLSRNIFFVCLLLGQPGFNCWVSFAPVYPWCCSTPQGSPGFGRNTLCLSSPHLCFIIVFILSSIVQNFSPIIYYRNQLSRNFFVCCWANRDSTVGFPLLQCTSGVVRHPRDLQASVATLCFCQVLIFISL